MLVPFECTIADIMHLRNRVEKIEYIDKLNYRTLFKHAPYDKNKESENFYQGILRQYTEKNGIINGSNLQNLRITHDLQCDFKPITGDELFSLRSLKALDRLYEKMGIVSRSIIYG